VPERFGEFARRYRAELAENPTLEHLREVARTHRVVTLVYSAKDTEHNQAVVLSDVLNGRRTLSS
jgi:DNA-3-methyladenine glycosylase